MTRRVLCTICDTPLPEEETTTLLLRLSFPRRRGIQPPPIEVKADLCSPECLAKFFATRAYHEARNTLEKWIGMTGPEAFGLGPGWLNSRAPRLRR